MNSPQFKGECTGIFNKQTNLSELRIVNTRSLVGLYISKTLLFTGIVMILLNNLNVLAPGSYFGAINWVTLSVFIMGLIINFACIPFLYFSSLRNFKNESEFWDKETFWILPLFFFGTFFLYGVQLSMASMILIFSIIIIALVHARFILESRKTFINIAENLYSRHDQYFVTMKYLTAYYVILLALLFLYNPLQHTFFWIRINL